MTNRVIASVSLPHWPIAEQAPIYQHAVVAVNGKPLATADAIYALVQRSPAGTSFVYSLEKDGQHSQVTLPSVEFTFQDYGLIFVAYLGNGLAIALIGIGVWFVAIASPASLVLLLVGLTGADLYFTQWFARLYVLAEAFLPAAILHLTLSFPQNRDSAFRQLRLSSRTLVAGLYGLALVVGIAFEIFLYTPARFSFIHHMCEIATALAVVAFVTKVVWDYQTTDSHLIRQKIWVVLLGVLGGFGLPILISFGSGLTGGDVAVNYMAFTVFLFPLSIGYAIVQHDLFGIDAALKKGAYYLALTVTLMLAYFAFLTGLNYTLRTLGLAESSLFPLFFTLLVVVFLTPLKDALQHTIDRLFFRLKYNPKRVLSQTSAALASTLQLEDIFPLIWQTIQNALGVRQGGIFLHHSSSHTYTPAFASPKNSLAPFPAEHVLIQAVTRKKQIVSHYDLPNPVLFSGQEAEGTAAFTQLGAQLLVPLSFQDQPVGIIVLGPKESGTFFSGDDIDFLSTLANQSAVSITNALTYQEVQTLNSDLEQKVKQRTQDLAQANGQLTVLLAEREKAYEELQRSQAGLVRAERLAALGRLTAGIAHEMNTPLGASLTALKLMRDTVTEAQQKNSDLEKLINTTQQWIEKAAAHIQSLRLHTRESAHASPQPFSVLRVLEDTRLLLAHRLRLSQCELSVSCPTPPPVVYGDAGKFGQVLTNLIGNAINACNEAPRRTGPRCGNTRRRTADDSDPRSRHQHYF
jgi:signal transduction histidine kinase